MASRRKGVSGQENHLQVHIHGMCLSCGRDVELGLYVWIQGMAVGVDMPRSKDYVRGDTVYQCSVCYKVEGGAAMFNILLMDPKVTHSLTHSKCCLTIGQGSVPTAIVNSQTKSHPQKWHKV